MKRSIQYRLLILFATSTLLPLLIMGSFLSVYFNHRSIKTSEQNISNTLYTVSENISMYLDDLKRLSLSPNVYPEVMELYEKLNIRETDESYSGYLVTYKYRTLMQQLLTLARSDINGISLIPLNNPDKIIYSINAKTGYVNITPTYHYENMPWYKAVMENYGAPVFSLSGTLEYYDAPLVAAAAEEDPTNIFSVTRLVRSDDLKSNIGIIKVDASSDVIRDIFDNIHTSEHSGLLLLDQNNDVIYSTDEELNSICYSLCLETSGDSTGNGAFYSYAQPISNTTWRLVYLSSKRDITEQSRTIFFITAFVAIVCLSVGLLIFYINSYRITAPVKRIIQTMKQVEQGNLNVHADTGGNIDREFTLIADALNTMIEKLDTHIANEYKAVISKRNAEYLALQTQINPHFLYNTLNGFITLNRLGEKKPLEDSILRLTALFRYTCSNEHTSTVLDEINFASQYLSLQKLRFDDRLDFSISIEDNVKNCNIPRLLVQPMVENAIIHGMEPCVKAFLVEIHACRIDHATLGSFLFISVVDNGAGFDKNTMKNKAHVGLNNITERLELYHSGSVFAVKSLPEKGTACHILIPADAHGGTHENTFSG